MNLTYLKTGQEAIIEDLDGDNFFISRLASFGLTVGAKLKMIQNHHKVPILVYIRDTRVAISKIYAKNIFVREVAGE